MISQVLPWKAIRSSMVAFLGGLVLLVGSAEASELPPHFVVPTVARVQGNDAFFTSRLILFNAGDEDLELQLRYTQRVDLGTASSSIVHRVAAGALESIDDPLGALFGFDDDDQEVGSLLVRVEEGDWRDLMVQSEVFARLDDGQEFGQFFPARPTIRALATGERSWLATTEDPQRNRVNFGATAVTDGTTLRLTPLDASGSPLASPMGIALEGGQTVQLNDVHQIFGIGRVPNLRLEAEVVTGRVFIYASVLDGTVSNPGSSDPTTILPAVEGAERLVLLELGPFQGIDEYSGSASISNLGSFDAEVRLDFHARGVPGVSASTSVSIPAGGTVGYGEIVGEIFGLSDVVGTVVVTGPPGSRLSATGREFSISRGADGEILGTAGQLMEGLRDEDLLQPDRSWHFLGLRQTRGETGIERSHLAIFNPQSRQARIDVDLFSAEGELLGSGAWSVRPLELVQINNLITFLDPDYDDGVKRIEVRVTEPVHARAFKVNAFGDPITIGPLPCCDVGDLETRVLQLPGGVELELVRVPPGSFHSDYWRQDVSIPWSLWVGRTEVTQAQWRAVMGADPVGLRDNPEAKGDEYPVFAVPWDAIEQPSGFSDRLNDHLFETGQLDGLSARLPTDVEWEWAARGGAEGYYAFEPVEDCSDHCGHCPVHDLFVVSCGNAPKDSSGRLQPMPTESLLPNDFGLHDGQGNVQEWVFDGTGQLVDVFGFPIALEDEEDPRHVLRGADFLTPVGFMDLGAAEIADSSLDDYRFGLRIVLGPWVPDPDFTWSPLVPVPGELVHFTDRSGGGVHSWEWRLPFGTTSTGQTTTHTFWQAGLHRVDLLVANDHGESETSKRILVASAPMETKELKLPDEQVL